MGTGGIHGRFRGRLRRGTALALGASLAALAAAPAFAQGTSAAGASPGPTAPNQPAGPAGGMDEIIVTALKRDQTLQEVPVAVTAFTAETIQRSGISRPIDFISATPNLSAVEANNAGDLRITIRGDAQALNTDAPVAVVIDGVVLTGATGLNKDLLDVQQIEVLKGPQGYLYGRNAISGAINITTASPTNEFQGRAKFGYGNGQTATGGFTVSGPIVRDKVLVSVSGGYRDSDGFYENITRGDKVDPYNEKSGRVRLDFLPTEDLRIQASAFAARIKGSATNYLSQSYFPGLQTSSPIVDADFADAPFVFNIGNFNTKKDDLVSLRLDYTKDWGQITSVSSYERQNNIFGSDGYPYTPGPGEGTQYNQREHTAYTTELRFASPSEERLRYIAGAYYADISQTPFLLAATGEDPGGFVVRRSPPILTGPNRTTGFSADNVDGEAWAVFANIDFDLTDTLTLTAAGRYDKEKKSATDVAFGNSAVTGQPFSATAGRVRSAKYDQFQPKLSLSWQAAEDVNLYGTYAVGFKAGGFNAAQAFTVTGGRAPNQYPAEKATNYEAGAKTEWLDGRLTANAAIFHTRKQNSQLFQFIPQGFLNAVTVIDRIKVTGGELELAAMPTDALTIRAGIGYTDAEITRLNANPAFEGNHAPYVPDWKTSLDGTYVVPLGDHSISLNARWDHTGRIYFNTRNDQEARRSSLDLISARVAYEAENWSLALWGKNLTDERYNSDVIVIFEGDPLPFTQAVFKAPPRTYGIELSVRF
ncbi:MAG TPA: TonB-dependent receptor [Azospirillaceae bacterium]|nr:TonB-dependent receptor [Azospirillaceae bacterium]